MYITFTKKEKQFLLIKKGNWSIKADCPSDIKERLDKKLKMLKEENRRNGKRTGSDH